MAETTLGERIRALRERAKMTQAALADAVGVRQPTMWRYEKDQMAPGSDVLDRIAAALGTTSRELLRGPQAPTPEPQTTPDLPPRLLAFLELVPVTEGERRHLIQQVASDGTVDYLAALHRLRAPEHKRTPEAPATLVDVPDDAPRARPAKRR